MQGTSIWWLLAVVGVLIILVAIYDSTIAPWLYERNTRKFYKKMKREQKYEN